MTDLPRFNEGKLGRLDFSHLNEVMRRLDMLRPLVENAALFSGEKKDGLDRPFLVYAETIGPQGFASKYKWTEIYHHSVDGTVPEGSPANEEPHTVRTGGIVNVDEGTVTGDYGKLLPALSSDPDTPTTGSDLAEPFYAMCFPTRIFKDRESGDENEVPPSDVHYYLLPVSSEITTPGGGGTLVGGQPVVCEITEIRGPAEVPVRNGTPFDAFEYGAIGYIWDPVEAELRVQTAGPLFDMSYGNQVMYSNWPSAEIDNSPMYKELGEGTLVHAYLGKTNTSMPWPGNSTFFMGPGQAPVDFVCP